MSALNGYTDLTFIGLLLLAYLLGSIPWGLILARIFAQQDIRQTGSRNIGATNVTRQAGVTPGLLTLIGDFKKAPCPYTWPGWLLALPTDPVKSTCQLLPWRHF